MTCGAEAASAVKKRAERLSRPARVSQPKETAEAYRGAPAAASSEIRAMGKAVIGTPPHQFGAGGKPRPAIVHGGGSVRPQARRSSRLSLTDTVLNAIARARGVSGLECSVQVDQ